MYLHFTDTWYQTGGVLLLGYEMYRLLSSKKVHLQKAKGRKKVPGSNVIDVEEEDRDKKLLISKL
jgi:RAD54-like protein 2